MPQQHPMDEYVERDSHGGNAS